MCKRWQFLFVAVFFLLLVPVSHGFSQESSNDREIVIYESELNELMQIIVDLENSNNEQRTEIEQMQQESVEREKYWKEYANVIENQISSLEMQRNLLAGGIIAAALTVAVVLVIK